MLEQVRTLKAPANHTDLGNNTPQCLAKSSDTSAPKIRILAIWFGANDACLKPSPQHVPLPEFIANLKKMVQMVKSPTSPRYSPETRIILISPPPVNTFMRRAILEARDPPIALDRGFEVTQAYATAVGNVAKEEGVAFADMWTPLWEAAGKDEHSLSKFLGDGLHLTKQGYQVGWIHSGVENSTRLFGARSCMKN